MSGENLVTFTKLMTVFDPEATGGKYRQRSVIPFAEVDLNRFKHNLLTIKITTK